MLTCAERRSLARVARADVPRAPRVLRTAADPNAIFKSTTDKVAVSATNTYFYELETVYSTTLASTTSSRRSLQSAAALAWQPPNLHTFGGVTMTLQLWRDYVASYITDSLGGRGVAFVTTLVFDEAAATLSANFMLVSSSSSSATQGQLAALLVAESSSSCSPLYAHSAFGFGGGLSLSTAVSGEAVTAATSNTTDWCARTVVASFSDSCAGLCNTANIPTDLGVAGAQLHAGPTPPTCPPTQSAPHSPPASSPLPQLGAAAASWSASGAAAANERSATALAVAVSALVIALFVGVGEAYLLMLRYLGYKRVRTGPLLAHGEIDSAMSEPSAGRMAAKKMGSQGDLRVVSTPL
jgi:hypothetical protein